MHPLVVNIQINLFVSNHVLNFLFENIYLYLSYM